MSFQSMSHLKMAATLLGTQQQLFQVQYSGQLRVNGLSPFSFFSQQIYLHFFISIKKLHTESGSTHSNNPVAVTVPSE